MFINQTERKIARSNPEGDFAQRINKRIERQRRRTKIIDIVLFTVLILVVGICTIFGIVIFG